MPGLSPRGKAKLSYVTDWCHRSAYSQTFVFRSALTTGKTVHPAANKFAGYTGTSDNRKIDVDAERLLLGRNDHRAHRSAAGGDTHVGAEAVDLISLQFGELAVGGVNHGAFLGVDFFSDLVALLGRIAEQRTHHFDDVFVGVIVVIKKQHVVGRKRS